MIVYTNEGLQAIINSDIISKTYNFIKETVSPWLRIATYSEKEIVVRNITRINLHHLIVFYFVAKEQSFTTAAEKLFLTESAVSQQIRALEISAGVKLLYVKKKRVHLTEAGQVLLRYAEKIYEQAKSADIFLEEIGEHSLRVGVSVTSSGIVSSAAAQLENRFPNTKISIQNGPSYKIVSQLLDLQYDVAVVISADYQTDKLIATRLSEGVKLLLLTSWSTPIGANDSLTLADLCDYKFLLPPLGSATRQVLLDRFKADGLELSNFLDVDMGYQHKLRMLVEVRNSIALLPEADARRAVSEGRIRILHLANELYVAVDALVIKDSPKHKITNEFIELVKQAFDASYPGYLHTTLS
jgi:DNA-binding transcriptional LysR family regulator